MIVSPLKTWTCFVSSSPLGLLSKPAIRNFSTNNVNSSNYIKPEIIYKNADTQKSLVFKDNKGKSGIYRWVNKENGNTYIGSSVNLGRRLRVYYDFSFLSVRVQKSKSRISVIRLSWKIDLLVLLNLKLFSFSNLFFSVYYW